MLNRIIIDNFRGFRELDAPISPVSVLLGPNSSGKTTVLHAIRLVCQAVDLALESESPARLDGKLIEVTRNTLIESPAHLLPLADWQALFVDQLLSQDTTSSISLHFDAGDPIHLLKLVMSYARNKQLKFTLTAEAPAAIAQVSGLPRKSSKVSAMLSEWLRRHAPRAVFIPPFYGVVKDEEFRMKVVVDRLVGSGDQSHVVRNLITGLAPGQLEQLNAFLLELTGATITYRTSGDKTETESPLRVEFKDTNGAIEISAAGAGLVNLVALYASLARWQTSAKAGLVLFLLDEPEAHLHPRLQGETARRIASLVTKEFGAQLLMATHSVEIINRLGERPHVTLLRTDRTVLPSATVLDTQQDIVGDLAEWADLTPFTAINFLASRRVLFHEGIADAKILRRCAELRYRQLPAKRRAFDRWALVPLDGAGNDKIPQLMNRLLKSAAWAAQAAQNQPFRLLTVLDRDYSRQSGFQRDQAEGAIHYSSLVWSGHSIESVFMNAKTLSYWIKGFAGVSAPPGLDDLLVQALSSANTDPDLQNKAQDQLALYLMRTELQDSAGEKPAINSDKHRMLAMQIARERVKENPADFQRGKDRASHVLTFIRAHIALPAKNQFPADLAHLLEKTDLNKVSDSIAAIPESVAELLEWMTTDTPTSA